MNRNSGWIITVWAAVILLKFGRLLIDFYYLKRLRTSYINTPEQSWTNRLQQLCRDMGIRKQVVLLESRLVNIPLVAGHFKPVILVPLGILTQLTPAELEAVLLHELAHIRRHDYLINLVQRVTCIIFFFNPGVLWLSSLIRAERENCCDDMAITHTNDKLQFVEALLSVKKHSMSTPPLAMNFLGKKNLLLHRVNRIVYNRNKSLNVGELLFFVFSIAFSVLLFTSARKTVSTDTELFPVVRHFESATRFSNLSYESPKQDLPTPIVYYREQQSVIKNNLEEKGTTKKPNGEIIRTKLKQLVNENISSSTPLTAHLEKASAALEEEPIIEDNNPHEKERAQAELNRIQAIKDRAAAERDRKQAEKDRAQADLDRKQAEKDRAQADLDRKQAERDRAQAELDRKEADKYREQAERERRAAIY